MDPATDDVVVHEWLKKAILLLFALRAMETIEAGPFEYADKLPLKHGLRRRAACAWCPGPRPAGAPTWRREWCSCPAT